MTRPKVKCVVWDLDDTLWQGVLSEGDTLTLRPHAAEVIRSLDERGILQSIASKNEPATAEAQLRKFGLHAYFLHPQIGWGPKSESLRRLAQTLNIGTDTFAFVDDQAFERDEVAFAIPEVRVYDSANLAGLLTAPEMTPKVVTDDARRRREMYQSDLARSEDEKSFGGPSDAFLKSLGMVLTVTPAGAADLARIEELVARTNQLNTTGHIYSYGELEALRLSPDHRLLVAELTDRYGAYGKIGVVLLHCTDGLWTIKLLLMSCRVMSRGVGGAIITWLRREARDAGVRLQADFRRTDRNRMMYVTYKFAGFSEVGSQDGIERLENNLGAIPELPGYLELRADPEGVLNG